MTHAIDEFLTEHFDWHLSPELVDFTVREESGLVMIFQAVKQIELHDAVIDTSVLLLERLFGEKVRQLMQIKACMVLTIESAIDRAGLVDYADDLFEEGVRHDPFLNQHPALDLRV